MPIPGWQFVELLACERSLLRKHLVVLPLLNRPFDSGVLKRRTFTYRAQSAVLAPWAASCRLGASEDYRTAIVPNDPMYVVYKMDDSSLSTESSH